MILFCAAAVVSAVAASASEVPAVAAADVDEFLRALPRIGAFALCENPSRGFQPALQAVPVSYPTCSFARRCNRN